MRNSATSNLILSITLATIACAPSHAKSNYAECILDSMPGVSNVTAMLLTREACEKKYPDRFANIVRGSGRGLFGYKSAENCIIKKSSSTPHNGAAVNIVAACWCLYGTPAYAGEPCAIDTRSSPRTTD